MDTELSSHIILLSQMDSSDGSNLIISIISFLLLLLGSGLVSASEVAYFSLGVKDIKELEDEDSPTSRLILSLKEK
ncbi:MAG: gliding motility-associated protein GldE, partial [Saprospiraceae bacterium]|nr:gliding motility-associated protein GldE [Saprospiraceae bacterium]